MAEVKKMSDFTIWIAWSAGVILLIINHLINMEEEDDE